jgi:hypothetical protein
MKLKNNSGAPQEEKEAIRKRELVTSLYQYSNLSIKT